MLYLVNSCFLLEFHHKHLFLQEAFPDLPRLSVPVSIQQRLASCYHSPYMSVSRGRGPSSTVFRTPVPDTC